MLGKLIKHEWKGIYKVGCILILVMIGGAHLHVLVMNRVVIQLLHFHYNLQKYISVK